MEQTKIWGNMMAFDSNHFTESFLTRILRIIITLIPRLKKILLRRHMKTITLEEMGSEIVLEETE